MVAIELGTSGFIYVLPSILSCVNHKSIKVSSGAPQAPKLPRALEAPERPRAQHAPEAKQFLAARFDSPPDFERRISWD